MLDKKLIRNINSQSPTKKETALHYACRNDNLEVLKFLVEHGSDVNLKGFCYFQPFKCQDCFWDLILLLLLKG